MRLPNEADKAIIKESLPAYSASLSDMLSSIVDREAIAFGEAVPTPMRLTFANHEVATRPQTEALTTEARSPQDNIVHIISRLRGEHIAN